MIYTVTFNPALDYVVFLDDLKLGDVNPVSYTHLRFNAVSYPTLFRRGKEQPCYWHRLYRWQASFCYDNERALCKACLLYTSCNDVFCYAWNRQGRRYDGKCRKE